MTDVKLALRGLRGEGFADLARRQGTLGVSGSATDAQVLDAFTDAAAGHATSAAASLNAAQVALAGLGIDQFFNTKALANAGTIANGELILVWADESQGGARTFYVKEAGVLVFKVQVGAPGRMDSVAGNLTYGSLAPSLTPGAVVGDHNGDANTFFGLNQAVSATSVYATLLAGWGAGNALSSGHSNVFAAYQAGLAATTASMNVVVGVDGFANSTAFTGCTLVGHHNVNLANFAGSGSVFVGRQIARFFTEGDDLFFGGQNVCANAPATGSAGSVAIGGNICIKSSISNSVALGVDIMQSSSGVGARSMTGSAWGGYRAGFGLQTSAADAVWGAFALFQADGDTTASANNAVVGSEAGYLVASISNVIIGPRAAAHAVKTTLTGMVVIGPRAGDVAGGASALNDNDFLVANSTLTARELLRGNFVTGALTVKGQLNAGGPIRSGSYTVGTVPSAATAGAGARIYVSNETGGAVLAFSDATDWRRVTDRAVIA